MILKSSLVLFVFFAANAFSKNTESCAVSKVFLVSKTDDLFDCQTQNDNFTKQIEQVLNTLNENISNYLQKVKQEIIEETENRLEAKLLKMKQDIIDSVQAASAKIPRDCAEVKSKGYKDTGIYKIQPYLGNDAISVLCDMTTKGGGWTYVINRLDGSQNFYLNWTDYKNGFGNPSGEHWIGLEHLYHLTNSKSNELLVELVDWDLKKVYANYSQFKIGSESEGYKLKLLGQYTGDAGDSLNVQLGNAFSTLDRDQDTHAGNCASIFRGAWWYSACFESHLTGRYVKNSNPVPFASGVHWKAFHGLYYSLKEARMMIRPLSTK